MLGVFNALDKKLFNKSEVRVHIQHDIIKPILFKRLINLAPGVDKEIGFFYEQLAGYCQLCSMISHVGQSCSSQTVVASVGQSPSALTLLPGGSSAVSHGQASFVFASQIPKGLSSSFFKTAHNFVMPSFSKKVVTIRDLEKNSDEERSEVVPILGKRSCILGESPSPKKLKTALAIGKSQVKAATFGLLTSGADTSSNT